MKIEIDEKARDYLLAEARLERKEAQKRKEWAEKNEPIALAFVKETRERSVDRVLLMDQIIHALENPQPTQPT